MENFDEKNDKTPLDSTKNGWDKFDRISRYDPLENKNSKSTESCSEENKSGDIKIESPFLKKLENFFYHYKWHTLIAGFFVFVLMLCVFQTCKKTTYDGYVLYAGGKSLRAIEENETESTFVNLYKALGVYVGDYNEDGERNLSFTDIYLPSDEEIRELEAEGSVNYSLLNNNDELFRNNMLSGDYYVCMISEHLFAEWTKENNPFTPIAPYLPSGAEIDEGDGDGSYRLASDYGVYLNSTPIKDKPGFKHLPDDTVICFRKYSKASSPGKRGKILYENSEKLIRAILKGEAYE